jgi:two-component system chemotaxis response regulator CheB
MKSLMAEVNESIDNGLWDTLRAIEERIMLLRQMADLVDRSTASLEADSFRRQADDAERRLQPLRELVLDPSFSAMVNIRRSRDLDVHKRTRPSTPCA